MQYVSQIALAHHLPGQRIGIRLLPGLPDGHGAIIAMSGPHATPARDVGRGA